MYKVNPINNFGEMLYNLGSYSMQRFVKFYDFSKFSIDVFKEISTFHKQSNVSNLVLFRQILFTGYEALGLVLILGASLGFITIHILGNLLNTFGQQNLIYTILIYGIIREASCLLTAFIIAARSGTAITTELGIMQTHNEVSFLQSIGISKISYLVIPRMIGVMTASIVLSVYFNISAILGGWFISSLFKNLPFSEFSWTFLRELTIADILISFLKSVIFGLVVSLLACYHGFKVKKSYTEIPQRTIISIVTILSSVIIINILIDLLC